MTMARHPMETVAFVDDSCAAYRDLFRDVRSAEPFTRLQLGLIRDVARKSLPALAPVRGTDPHALHHVVASAEGEVTRLRQLTRAALPGRSFVLCMDETADHKDGTTMEYVSRQYIGNLGTVKTGLVSVPADGGLADGTFPRLFQVCTPSIASGLVRSLVQPGFAIDPGLADAAYGASGPLIQP